MRNLSAIRFLSCVLFLLAVSAASFAQIAIGISVGFAPPPIPVYEQPVCPVDGYLWIPGLWAWNADVADYYWVPGTWVEPPVVGFLWTPGWWGWEHGGYFFHEGYWGPHVGWYGGINYGFGYFGHGYEGGRWDHDRFFYNHSVTNVNITEIHNAYNTTIINRNESRVSYNGGNDGISERPSSQEETYSRERHITAVAAQQQHIQAARSNRELRASINQGRPPIAATRRPGSFSSPAVVPVSGRYEPPSANRPANTEYNANRPPSTHAKEIAPYQRPAPPITGNPKLDQKYEQQQQKLYAKQTQQVQRLEQQQERDHQRLAQQNADEASRQQMEQHHQQQTQQLQERHIQQQQQMQQRQQQAGGSRGR